MSSPSEIKYHPAAYVLDNCTSEEVASAMIEGGQKEPFYIFDMDKAYHRIQHFRKMMPRIQIFYAMKANDFEMMLKVAAATKCGFDCASPGEIRKILQLNVNPLSIINALPAKTPEQMTYARKCGVMHNTFDSSQELKKLKQNWPDARLLIRIKVESQSVYCLGDKFGCDHETEAIQLLEEAATLNLNVAGVAFHVGSVCFSIDSYRLGLEWARRLFDHQARAGRTMNIVDIGGGFLSDTIDRIDEVSQVINRTLEELFPDHSVQVIAEPGRYLCDSTQTLFCSLSNIRQIKQGDKVINMLYMNDGLFGTLRYNESWHTVEKFERKFSKGNKKLHETILWGPRCHSLDRVMQNCDIRLPQCTPFDWLVFKMQGGYTFGYASQFSSLERPLCRPIISKELWNKIKDSEVFDSTDFIEDPDISKPLPSSMPPLVLTKSRYLPNVPILKV